MEEELVITFIRDKPIQIVAVIAVSEISKCTGIQMKLVISLYGAPVPGCPTVSFKQAKHESERRHRRTLHLGPGLRLVEDHVLIFKMGTLTPTY